MSRLRADFLLLITAIIWGFAFIAQKQGMDDGLGPLGFVGVRFLMSLIIILPFVMRESRRAANPVEHRYAWPAVILCFVFLSGVILQHVGILYTTVTNAGFLTGLYVIFVPMAAWVLFRKPPAGIVWGACVIALMGVWFLNGMSISLFGGATGKGDAMILGCAFFFGMQVALIGWLVQRTRRPFFFAAIQYAVCAVVGLAAGVFIEGISMAAIEANIMPLLYAGLISGGIAYSLQFVAQQHTPPADSAVILSGEAFFAAIGGAVMLGERLSSTGWIGCGLIVLAILITEVRSLFLYKNQSISV